VKSTSILFPYSQVGLDFPAAGRIPACSDADLSADTCPPSTALGDVHATVPALDPPDFTGTLYRTNHPEIGFFTVAVVLHGARGVKTVVHGKSEFLIDGTAFVFPVQPQVPLTSLEVALTKKIYKNLSTCGSKEIPATFTAWSGPVVTVADRYQTTGFNCQYGRPKSSTPVSVKFVPSFEKCTAPNGSHGAPLASASCSPPNPTSDHLTVGTPDANGRGANFTGEMTLKTIGESPIDPDNGDQADVQISTHVDDVRNTDLTDYTGELRAVLGLRITDRLSGQFGDSAATVVDTPLSFNVPCTATAGPEGASCDVTTTADAVSPGIATEGARTVWRLGQVQLFDGGADGDGDTADNTLFAVQGTFAP
jgi:hypothetical protein